MKLGPVTRVGAGSIRFPDGHMSIHADAVAFVLIRFARPLIARIVAAGFRAVKNRAIRHPRPDPRHLHRVFVLKHRQGRLKCPNKRGVSALLGSRDIGFDLPVVFQVARLIPDKPRFELFGKHTIGSGVG